MSFSGEFVKLKLPDIATIDVVPHKDYEWIEQKLQLWYAKNSFPTKLAKENHTGWLCRVYANAVSKQRLLLVGKLNMLLFVIDDKSERLSAKTKYDELVNYFHTLRRDFMDFSKINQNSCYESRIFLEIWEQMLPDLSVTQSKLLLNMICDYFQMAINIQCNYRRLNKYIPLKTYMSYRRVDGCTLQMYICAEYSLGIDFSDQMRETKQFKELVLLSMDRLLISHDIMSFKVELPKGEIMNYAMSYVYENQCTLQEAIDQTFQYLKEIDLKYSACVESWRKSDDPAIKAFLQPCLGNSHGIVKWHTQTTRYDCNEQKEFVKQSINSRLLQVENIIKCRKLTEKDKTVSDVIGVQNAKKYFY